MNYIVLETQTNNDGTIGSIITAFDAFYPAESKYHSVLASAALSDIPVHCVFMLADSGQLIKSERYEHLQRVTTEVLPDEATTD